MENARNFGFEDFPGSLWDWSAKDDTLPLCSFVCFVGEAFPLANCQLPIAICPPHALATNSRVSVDTLTFSPCLRKRGTRISSPVSSVAGLVTLPPEESPRTPGSVWQIVNSTCGGSCKPIGLPLYLCT